MKEFRMERLHAGRCSSREDGVTDLCKKSPAYVCMQRKRDRFKNRSWNREKLPLQDVWLSGRGCVKPGGTAG